ncbi:MAG: RNase adapter RapZ [Coriobacteriia bacterium]|nr:RNase adapter RapZ [Coriobacteriia bacterium]MCL2746626.1 RNase adapter RapZ [Coriobacteriia bacterium]MCL2870913.1 RNase adapter RapZ [Coriobacteriia bacterium]
MNIDDNRRVSQDNSIQGQSSDDLCPHPYDARLVIVTGMSGAGRSRALASLEDFGYFCVDNLPPQMIPQIAQLAEIDTPHFSRIAVACDIRGGKLFDSLLDTLDSADFTTPHALLFLEASDKVLLNRYKESRRRHPLEDGRTNLKRAIELEREILEPLRARADQIIDTTLLRASELRGRIQSDFITSKAVQELSILVSSFGFKYGAPADADIIYDVRFLPNPYWDPDLRPLSGKDAKINQFVLGRSETQDFLEKWIDLLATTIPYYISEGKLALNVSIGCTGGRHRSVVLAEETTKRLRSAGYQVTTMHRDIMRDTEQHDY